MLEKCFFRECMNSSSIVRIAKNVGLSARTEEKDGSTTVMITGFREGFIGMGSLKELLKQKGLLSTLVDIGVAKLVKADARAKRREKTK